MGNSMKNFFRSQSAMEYLMTYGWAILIIAVVLGALFQLGVFNSSSFSPRAPPGACQVFRPNGPGTTQNINLMGVCTGQLPQYIAKFNGASYVNVAHSNLYSAQAFTVSFWVSEPATQSWTGVVDKGRYGSPYDWYFFTPYTTCSGTGQGIIFSAGGELCYQWNDPVWHFVTGTYSTSTLNEYLYVDGALKLNAGVTRFTPQQYPLAVGAASPLFTSRFAGLIANVQVYNTSLSANQIQALYLEGMGSAPMLLQNLVGWWPLNGNSNDYSGNNNNGVPTAVTFTSQYGK